jgi:hypothetical protein
MDEIQTVEAECQPSVGLGLARRQFEAAINPKPWRPFKTRERWAWVQGHFKRV